MHRTYLYLFKIMWVWLLFYVRFFVVFFTHHNIWLYGEKFVCVFFFVLLTTNCEIYAHQSNKRGRFNWWQFFEVVMYLSYIRAHVIFTQSNLQSTFILFYWSNHSTKRPQQQPQQRRRKREREKNLWNINARG